MSLALMHVDRGRPDRRRPDDAPRPARRPRPHLLAAVVTALCVGGGFVLVMATAPRPATPGTVAREFIEARIAQDWETVWRLHCRSVGLPDQDAFVERMTSLDRDVEQESALVVVKDVSEDHVGAGLSFTVTVVMSGFNGDGPTWRNTGQVPVVGEDGDFRVCIPPGGTS